MWIYKMMACHIRCSIAAITVILSTLGWVTCVSFPHIITKGTHYEIGKDIGSTFRPQIQEYYSLHPMLHSVFLPWSESTQGMQVLDGYIQILRKYYPQYLREMQGIAHGADIPINQVILMCYAMEISAIINQTASMPSECSDILMNLNDCIYIGHNEDSSPLIKSRGYFVSAHIIDNEAYPGSKIQVREEKITYYSYPGVIGGNAFGFNSHGLIQTMNALYPQNVGLKKTGRYILTRAALSAKSLDEVKDILTNEGVGAAYGFGMNLGILPNQQNGLGTPQIWNLEVAPTDGNSSDVNVYQLQHTVVNDDGNYYHVNKYRRLQVKELPHNIVSSIHRTKKIEEMMPIKDRQQILDILGDTTDKKYPIYRNPVPTDPESTEATALFDLLSARLVVYKDNPAHSKAGPVLNISLPW